VLEVLPVDRWTVVHGQCLSVGVGGFLLGGGVNMVGTTARHGAGMQNVLRYNVVTADGSVAEVTSAGAKVTSYTGETSWTNFTWHDDLYFGLRGAGASLGVVTEFLYTVHPHPETTAAVLLLHVSTLADLRAIESAAASTNHFQFGLYNNYFPAAERRPRPGVLAARRLLLGGLAWWAGEEGESLVLSVTDVRPTAGPHTNVTEVLELIKPFGLRLAISSPRLVDAISRQFGNIMMRDYESEYMEAKEIEEEGFQAVASANLGGVQTIEALADTILADETFGVATKYSTEALAAGCDFCFLAVNFNMVSVPRKARIALTEEVGRIQAELTCTYRPGPGASCPARVRAVREGMVGRSVELGGADSQYVNTPSCQAGEFGARYWGSNYPQLQQVKAVWDPANMFNYCHSLGGDSGIHCCP
jgi:FAD/FMN-containing dehydrogenase